MRSRPDSVEAAAADRRTVHRWSVGTTALTLVLIVAGALVTSRDAGLAVPDWPLSFGTINPPHWYAIENVRTEHGHRVIAGCVALATILMALSIRKRESDPLVRRLGGLAVAAVLLQALLGGLRVLHLSVDLAMVHGCLGQLFLCVVVAIATLTSLHWSRPPAANEPRKAVRSLAGVLPFAVLGQLVLGILIRHGGPAADRLLASPLFFVHVAVALTIVAVSLRLRAWLVADDRGEIDAARPTASHATRRSGLLAGLVLAQVAVGLASFVVTQTMTHDRQATFLESWVPTLHVALGAAILATSVVVALHVRLRPQRAALGSARTAGDVVGASTAGAAGARAIETMETA